MRAAVLTAHGSVPELQDHPDPEPAPGAVVLDVQAAAMNPIDVRVASGQFPLERYQPLHAAHAELLNRAGDTEGAARAYERAIELSGNAVERAELERRRGALH